MAIELPDETKEHLLSSIVRFFEERFEQEIGDLKAALLLDYVLKEIGPSIYNAGVADAQARMSEMVDEIDATCYEPEYSYWEKRSKS